MRSMINTNTTKLHTAKNSNGNSLPQGSPGNMEDLTMPQGFQHGETPKGAQGQEEGEIAQPKKRWWHFGRGKQDQAAQPIPASVAGQETVEEPVGQVSPVKQAREPQFKNPDEARQFLKDSIALQTKKLEVQKKRRTELEKEYNETMAEIGKAKKDSSPAGIERSRELTDEFHRISAERVENELQIKIAGDSITAARQRMRLLPKEPTEIEKGAKALLDAINNMGEFAEQSGDATMDSAKLAEEIRKMRETEAAAISMPQETLAVFDEEQEARQKAAYEAYAAWERQQAANQMEAVANAESGQQLGSIH